MTVKEILDASKEKMSKSVAVYQNEMTSLRAGRANPRLLDRIMVDYYGTPHAPAADWQHQRAGSAHDRHQAVGKEDDFRD